VQVAPISLPRLKKGTNQLRYDAGDRYGGATMPVLVLPNLADPEDLARHVAEMPKNYDPKRNLTRVVGNCIVKMTAPPGSRIAWLSAGATFNTFQQKAAVNTANRIGYAVAKPAGGAGASTAELEFKDIYNAQGQIPTWVEHWRYNHDADIRLDEPAETVYVRYFGSPGVNVVRACLHCTPPRPHDPAVKITHAYELDGKPAEKTVEMSAPGQYAIDCPGEKVENVFVRIEKPSI